MKTKKIIMVELVETNVFSRWHCTVCDGCTDPPWPKEGTASARYACM